MALEEKFDIQLDEGRGQGEGGRLGGWQADGCPGKTGCSVKHPCLLCLRPWWRLASAGRERRVEWAVQGWQGERRTRGRSESTRDPQLACNHTTRLVCQRPNQPDG